MVTRNFGVHIKWNYILTFE